MIDYSQIPEVLHERIKFIREKHNFTQKDVAEQLRMDRAAYSRYETDERKIPVDAIKKLAKLYHLSSDFILGLSANPEYIDFENFSTGLSEKAMNNLQQIYESNNNSLKGINKLLESDLVHEFVSYLNALMFTVENINAKDFNCNENVAKTIISIYKLEHVVSLPSNLIGVGIGNTIDYATIIKSALSSTLDKIIDKVKTEEGTRKDFADELYRRYDEMAKNELK